MAKPKQDNKQSNSGDFGAKQMVLKLDASIHKQIKTIAEQTGVTQPNVVSLILGEAIQDHPESYIDQIKKLHAKEALQKLEEKARAIEDERQRLLETLKR